MEAGSTEDVRTKMNFHQPVPSILFLEGSQNCHALFKEISSKTGCSKHIYFLVSLDMGSHNLFPVLTMFSFPIILHGGLNLLLLLHQSHV
jgi:hypothetical protein